MRGGDACGLYLTMTLLTETWPSWYVFLMMLTPFLKEPSCSPDVEKMLVATTEVSSAPTASIFEVSRMSFRLESRNMSSRSGGVRIFSYSKRILWRPGVNTNSWLSNAVELAGSSPQNSRTIESSILIRVPSLKVKSPKKFSQLAELLTPVQESTPTFSSGTMKSACSHDTIFPSVICIFEVEL